MDSGLWSFCSSPVQHAVRRASIDRHGTERPWRLPRVNSFPVGITGRPLVHVDDVHVDQVPDR